MKYIAILLLFIVGCSPYAANPFEIASIEAVSAYAVAMQSNKTEVKPQVQCKCNGTKKVKSGDGLLVIDCPCDKNCICKGGNQVVETRQLVLRTDPSWCKPCVKVAKQLEKLLDKDKNWKISTEADAHIRIMPPIENESIPVLILYVNGKEVNRWEGDEKIGDYKAIANHYYGK